MREKTLYALLIFATLAGLISFSLPDAAHACSCVANYSQEQAYEDAEAVFVGRVLGIQEHRNTLRQIFSNGINPSYRAVEFHVTDRWKGIEKNLVTVATGFGGGDCGFHFAEGEQYLVYAYDGSFHGKELETGICQRTEVLRHAEDDIVMLGPGNTTFTDEESVYDPTNDSTLNEVQNKIAEILIEPITRTTFVAPWYIALGIISLYITPPISLAYWMVRRKSKKKRGI
ncbi:MAG: hypothetical protein WD509_02555 [Candidatus Paceibacterota bacterium]